MQKIRKILFRLVQKFNFLFNDKIYLKIIYFLGMGRKLNLSNPKRFSEKIQWLKLYNRKSLYTQMVDKVEVKKYVSSAIGTEYIVPTIKVWDKIDDINVDSLPEKFVLKTTGGGGSCGVVICRNKSCFDLNQAKTTLNKSFKDNIYRRYREWPYKNVSNRIIAEELLDYETLFDYKFFCFNGVPKYCQVISGRDEVMSIDFFDKEWNHQNFHEPREYPFAKRTIPKPKNFSLMLDLAKKLANGIPFVRIDFYNIEGRIYFGEITFFPTSGLGGFEPDEYDLKWGELLHLPSEKCI